MIAILAFCSPSIRAETLQATYITGKEVPMTAAGYTATGNTVAFSLGYAPARGTQLRVVNNTGRDFIQGTFSDLANGAPVDLSFGGIIYHFVAWYYGGDGNDLVLLWRDTGISAWGYNGQGQLGDGSTIDRSTPATVRQFGALAGRTVVSVAAGFAHSFALCTDGTLAAWGAHGLGNGTNSSSYSPVTVPRSGVLAGKTVVAIAAGDSHKLVLCSDGTLAAWGDNSDGQLGDGSSIERYAPVLVDQGGVLAGKTVVAIEAGTDHSLALCSDGTLAAWGRNSFGQLGDGTTTSSDVPVSVTQGGVLAGKTIAALSAGFGHTLVLCSDGTLASWGRNNEGQLGNGSTTSSNVPVLVTQSGLLAGKTVVAIAAGRHFGLALCSDSTLAAWGSNSEGQLGIGSTTGSHVPIAVYRSGVLNNKTITAIAAGASHGLVHCADGTLTAWGRNMLGQIGIGTPSNSQTLPTLVRQTGVLAERTIFPVSAGTENSFALYPAPPEIAVRQMFGPTLTDGTGSVSFGTSVFAGTETEHTFTIENIGTGDLTGIGITFGGIDAGSFSVTSPPALQVPPGGTTQFTVRFLPMSGGQKVATLRISNNDSDENPFDITLTGSSQTTVTAIYTSDSQVPLATNSLIATPNTVNFALLYAPAPGTQLMVVNNTGRKFIQGAFTNLANGAAVDLTYNGITYRFVAWYFGGDGNDLVLLWRGSGLTAWGANAFGQLGDGSTSNRNVPVAITQTGLLAGKTVVSLVPGKTHSLALCSDGTLAAWGSNSSGQLGNGTNTDRNIPVAVIRSGVLSGKTVVALAAGNGHSLALCSDGTIAAWGANGFGQLGNGTLTDRNTPVAVTQSGVLAGKSVIALAAGDGHSLALCSDGTLAAWGRNADGQLGDGSNLNHNVPVSVDQNGVLANKTVVALAAGGGHSLVRCSDGTLSAWGRNIDGELGDGSTTGRNVPGAITQNGILSGKTVVALVAGDGHSLALCSDGTLAAWGRNNDGQLGDGSNSNSNVPLAITQSGNLAGKTVVSVAAGSSHSLARCSDGNLAAWGRNDGGQLGVGSNTASNVPTAVNQSGELAELKTLVLSGGEAHSLALSAARPEPEIGVQHPAGTLLTDGGANINFGSLILVGAATERVFTIRNTGPGTLTGLDISIVGTHASDFRVTAPPAPHVNPGGSTSFTVRFSPANIGSRSAALRVASNDQDENPFDISLNGTASSAPLTANFVSSADIPLNTVGFNATGKTVNISLYFTPDWGANLKVVNNTGEGFIQGTFNNLPNGAPVDLVFGGVTYHFVAWYYGGDGNDLVLLWRDTELSAWGSNAFGQFGNGFTSSSNVPVMAYHSGGILAGKTIVSIAGGDTHSVALCSDGTLAAWGANGYGQLGDGTTTTSLSPVAVDRSGVLAGKTVISLAVGQNRSFAICSDGTVAAWGENGFGALGDGSTANHRTVPVLVHQSGVLAGKTVVAIAAGSAHSIALCSDGTLAAWGWNILGQLGIGSSSPPSNVPVLVNQSGALARKTVVAISAGIWHSLALCSDGTVAAWGSNSFGQIGDGTYSSSPTPVLADHTGALLGKSVIAISAGNWHSLVLCSDGSLCGWGNEFGPQLDGGTILSSNVPVFVDTSGVLSGKAFVAISASNDHSRVLCSDGSIAAWGRNTSGQLGDGSNTYRKAPVLVDQSGVLSGSPVLSISRGSAASHTHALIASPPEIVVEQPPGTELSDGGAAVNFGALLLAGTATERTFTVRNTGRGDLTGLTILFDGTNASDFKLSTPLVRQVAPGDYTTFKVRFSPTGAGTRSAFLRLYSNDRNENSFDIPLTGTGETNTTLAASFSMGSEPPLSSAGFTATGNTVSLSLHYAPTPGTHLRLVDNTGSGFIIGRFSNLANGAPVSLHHNGINYHFVAWYYGGDGNDLVLVWRDTALAGWGDNLHGQLGDGSNTESSLPKKVIGSGILAGKTIVGLSTGLSHSLALCSDGTLTSWGINNNGELGNGSSTKSNIPVAVNRSGVLSGRSVIALASGGSHNLVLCSDGTLASWGLNINGQLGNGSSTTHTSPTPVTQNGILTGMTVVAIAAGSHHSLALCSNGTIAAWGDNTFGQLGTGSNSASNVPAPVDWSGVLSNKIVVAIAASGRHSLALCSDGTLVAWGNNGSGQLGNGSNLASNVPVLVERSGALADKTISAIAAGSLHSLALCSDGTLAAWGENAFGQLGNGSNLPSNVPVVVARNGVLTDKTISTIAAGSHHSLALCSDGALATWGKNSRGQLGDGTIVARNAPVLVDRSALLSGSPIISVYSGTIGDHSLALYPAPPEIVVEQPLGVHLTDGSDTIDFGTPVFSGASTERVFTVRNTGSGELAGTIAISGAHSADFFVAGDSGINVQPGGAATFTVRFSPSSEGTRIADLRIDSNDSDENPFDVSLTGMGLATSTLAADYDDGSEVPLTSAGFTATGNMVDFSLGHAPDRGAQLMVVENTDPGFIKGTFSNLPNGASIELSHEGIVYHFVAWYYGGDGNDLVLLWRDTGLAAWGLNSSGQLGNGSLVNSNLPTAVNQNAALAGKTIVAIASGNGHSMGLCSDGTLAAWGLNSSGQLGDGTETFRHLPVVISQIGALSGKIVIALATGGSHSLALCSDGTLATWGLNSSGQLGDGTNNSSNVPVDITQSGILAGKTVVAIAAGTEHNLVLCSDGTLAAWGANVEGRLGDGSNTSRNVPVPVVRGGIFTGRRIVRVAAGGSHSLALCSDGTLAAWGGNTSGQLGNGSNIPSNIPVLVDRSSILAGKTVVTIAAGYAHSLALSSDGPLAAWGYGMHGQLGNRSNADSAIPVMVDQSGVLGGRTVVGLSAGSHHNLALCSDGTLAAWGLNSDGQLGKGDNAPVNFPSPITANGALSGNPILRTITGSSSLHSLALYAVPPEIVVEQSGGINLTDGSHTIDFGSEVLVGGFSERSFTIRNSGRGELSGLTFTIDGPHAGDFTISSSPALQVARGEATTFTVRFDPSALGSKNATLHLFNNDTDENPFDILLSGTAKPGAHVDLGDPVNLDLSWVPLSTGETFRVLGLPPGLALNLAHPPSITGSALGGAPNGGVWIQILRGNIPVKTLPFELSITSPSIVGDFELLLEESGQPKGILRLKVTGPTPKAQSPAYSATLERLGEPRRAAKGTFARTDFPQTISVSFPALQTLPVVNFDIVLSAGSDLVAGVTNPSSGLTARGFRLVRPGRAPAGNPAFTLSLPPAATGDRTTVPRGIGHANGIVNSKSLLPLSGLLGDAQRFATALSLSHTNQAVVWITPYRNRLSYIGGIIEIGEMGAANRGASTEAASDGLQWKREGDLRELSYPNGFGPLAVSANASRWVSTPTAEGLAQSLGLDHRAIDVSYIAPTTDVLPNKISLRDSFSLLQLGPADSVPFAGIALAKTGTFAASMGLSSPVAKSAVSGVFIQDDGFSPLIAQGLMRIPVTGPGLVKGAFQTAGIEFFQASTPSIYRYRVGSPVAINLGFIPLGPDETLRVTGLPAGLVFNPGPPPTISGTVLGLGTSAGVRIQVLRGKQITRTIPLDLAVEGFAWEGSYEALLEVSGRPVGKLKVMVNPPTTRSPAPTYSATLERLGEARRGAKGSFATTGSPPTATVVFPGDLTTQAVTFNLVFSPGSDMVTGRTSPASTMTARGFRLARLGRIPTGNPSLTMAFPPAVRGNRINTPGGIGFARGSISSKALVPVTGQLGDAQPFAASLSLSQTNQAVLWITPYTNKSSYFGGIINLGKAAAPDDGAPLESTPSGLKWARVPDPTALSYRAGFGALDLQATTSFWVPFGLADALAESLSLVHRDIRVTYVAPTTAVLPTLWNLRNDFALIRVFPSDSVSFVGKADARGGGFGGTLTLPTSRAFVSGIFLQDESFGELIGQGVVRIPLPGSDPVKGVFETSGIELRN